MVVEGPDWWCACCFTKKPKERLTYVPNKGLRESGNGTGYIVCVKCVPKIEFYRKVCGFDTWG